MLGEHESFNHFLHMYITVFIQCAKTFGLYTIFFFLILEDERGANPISITLVLPVAIALVLLCFIVFGIALIVICVKRRKKKEFEISSSETPEHIYDVPEISISQSNPKFELSAMKMRDENKQDPTEMEENVAYGIFGSVPGTAIRQYT